MFDEEPDGEPHGECREEIRKLEAEIEALRADAERYRWLRCRNWSDDAMCIVTNPRETVRLGTFCPSNEQLDAAIDAARKK